MLGVFINLSSFFTMPNTYYSTTYMLLYPHLMAKHCLKVGIKLIIDIRYLRHETSHQVAVKVWWMDLQSCWECSSTCYVPIQCQTYIIQQPTCCYTPTWWPIKCCLKIGFMRLSTLCLFICSNQTFKIKLWRILFFWKNDVTWLNTICCLWEYLNLNCIFLCYLRICASESFLQYSIF